MSFIRTLFPFFTKSKEVYLDTAATSQRLGSSLLAMNEYYENFNANVHRGNYASAIKASNEYESARQTVAEFIGAQSASQIVFTSGATEALNLVANGVNINDLHGNVILLCESEHHANLLPWQAFALRHKLILKRISLGKNGVFTDIELEQALNSISEDVAVLAIAHVSNALGNIYPVKQLCKKASQVNALTVIDGTQAAAHIPIDVRSINCDFYCFSGHKMYAGTGIGVLFGKMKWLEKLSPSKLGGEMITQVSWDNYQLQPPPTKFEAGTPNIAGALSLVSAIHFIKQNYIQIQTNEHELTHYILAQLMPLVDANKLILLGNVSIGSHNTISLVSFYVPNMHANDVAMHMATQNIAVRAGHHCAMPLMQSLNIDGCVRVSMGCYTSKGDVDSFMDALSSLFSSCHEYDVDIKTSEQTTINKPTSSAIETALKEAGDWNSKHRLLLLHSKHLNILQENERLAEYEVAGCEAQVWLTLSAEKLSAYSNSKVVRGILAVIIDKIERLPSGDELNFDINGYLASLGLSHYFSQGRRDGIQQVILRINELLQQQ
jgi:cysteine desulfurase/selenocysteine lyase